MISFVTNLLTCHFNRYEGDIPRHWTKPSGQTDGPVVSTVETDSVLSKDLAWHTETDRQTVWCQLSLLSISRHYSSSCCYGQPTPPWQPTGCKSSVWGRKKKREFVCHAITFKWWWHVSKSFSCFTVLSLSCSWWPFLSFCLQCLLTIVSGLLHHSMLCATLPGHCIFILQLIL